MCDQLSQRGAGGLSIATSFVHDADMILSYVLERFVEKEPISLMTRTMMEVVLALAELDALFDSCSEQQHTRSLLFSSMVNLLGMAVSEVRPSVNAAYQRVKATLPVSLSAVDEQLNGLEPPVTSALVRQSAEKLEQEVVAMKRAVACAAAWISSQDYRWQPPGCNPAATQGPQAQQGRTISGLALE